MLGFNNVVSASGVIWKFRHQLKVSARISGRDRTTRLVQREHALSVQCLFSFVDSELHRYQKVSLLFCRYASDGFARWTLLYKGSGLCDLVACWVGTASNIRGRNCKLERLDALSDVTVNTGKRKARKGHMYSESKPSFLALLTIFQLQAKRVFLRPIVP